MDDDSEGKKGSGFEENEVFSIREKGFNTFS